MLNDWTLQQISEDILFMGEPTPKKLARILERLVTWCDQHTSAAPSLAHIPELKDYEETY